MRKLGSEEEENPGRPEGGDSAPPPLHFSTSPLPSFLSSGPVRALRHRNFLLLWLGMLVVFTGNWVQSVALSWLVYEMTNSPLLLGVVGFCGSIPLLFFSLPAGVVVDRVDRRRLLLVTQTIYMLNALALAALTTTGLIQVWQIVIIAFISGTIASLDWPCRQSLVPDLVGEEDLLNAVALQSAAFNSSRIIGPPIAAALIGLVGAAGAFWVNASGYVIMLVALVAMQVPARKLLVRQGWWGHLVEGLVYVRDTPLVFALLGLVAVPTVFGMPYVTLMPVFARDVLGVGPAGLGALMSAIGIGALVAALGLATLGELRHKMRFLLVGAFLFGIMLVLFASSHWFGVSLFLLAAVGLVSVAYTTMASTMLQLTVPAELRGRIMSVYVLVWGLMPLGQLPVGAGAGLWGAPLAVGLGGAISAAFVLAVAWRMPDLQQVE